MDKVFAVAGISTLEGKAKVRFAKDMARVKVLEKNGHKAINLIELPKAMGKDAAVAYLKSHAAFKDAAAQAVLNEYLGEAKPAKVTKMAQAVVHAAAKTVKAKVAKAVKTPEEIEVIKSKNLQTMKAVHARLKAAEVRSGEVELQDRMESDEDIRELELEIPGLAKRERDDIDG